MKKLKHWFDPPEVISPFRVPSTKTVAVICLVAIVPPIYTAFRYPDDQWWIIALIVAMFALPVLFTHLFWKKRANSRP